MAPQGEAEQTAFREVWLSYPLEERSNLLNRSITYASMLGDKIFLSSGMMLDPFRYNLFFNDEDLIQAARRLSQPLEGVVWNGEAERFEFQDPEVRLAVLTVASRIAAQGAGAIEVMEKHDPTLIEVLRLNRHSDDPQTRVEPSDLVQGLITENIYRRSYGSAVNRISLTKAVHRQLYKLLKVTPDLDPRGGTYQDIFVANHTEDPEFLIILGSCQGLTVNSHNGTGLFRSSNFIKHLEISRSKSHTHQLYTIDCDGQGYTFEIERLKGEPLSPPLPYDILRYEDRDKIDILVTYALTAETNGKLLSGVIAYLASKGYVMNPLTDIRRGIPSKEAFDTAFKSADIYIPAAHALDLDTFELGTSSSTVMTFTKRFRHKSGRMLKARVTALFPEKSSGNSLVLSRNDLAQLLSLRREKNPLSLFVLTTSCGAGETVHSWTSAYRKSLEKDVAQGKLARVGDATDLIHAIAPEGGFATSTPSQLLQDFAGPLHAVRILLEGGSPRDVFEYLKKEIEPDRFVKFVAKIEGFFGKKAVILNPIRFSPRYNLNTDGLLDEVGFDFKLSRNPSP